METLDIILLLCFVPALITGIRKGVVEQIVSLVSIFAGVWAAFKFSTTLAGWLATILEADAKILNIVSFALTVIVAVVLLHIVGKIISKTLRMASLGWADRLLGFVFALFKAALAIGIIIFVFDPLNAKFGIVKTEILDNSIIYTSLRDLATKVFPYLKELLENVQTDIH